MDRVTWRGKVRLIRAVLQDRPVMSLVTFRWSSERGWQLAELRGCGGGEFVSCTWDGGESNIVNHPWTTLPYLEADMVGQWVRCEEAGRG